MFSFNLRQWLKRWIRPRARTIEKRPRVRLILEELEARLAPASVWTGHGADANWSTAGNWSGTVPTAGATVDLLFPSGPAIVTSNDDINVNINTMTIAAGTAYTFTGSAGVDSTLANGTILVANGASATFNASFNLKLGGAAASTEAFDLQTGASMSFAGNLTSASSQAQLSAVLSGSLTLSGNNSGFTGPFNIANGGGNGVVIATNGNALGSGNTVTLATSTQLQLNVPAGGAIFNNTLVLNGSGTAGNGALLDVSAPVASVTNTWAGNIIMNAANGTSTTMFDVLNANETLKVTGQVSNSFISPYTVTKEGAGILYLDPMNAVGNTYSATTNVNAGMVEIGHPFALGVAGGSTVVNCTALESGTLGIAYDPANTFIPAQYLNYAQVQTITFAGAVSLTTQFTVSYNGVASAPVIWQPTIAATATMLQAALNAVAMTTINGIGAMVTVVGAGNTLSITFSGSLGGMEIPTVTAAVTGAGSATVSATSGTTPIGFTVPNELITVNGMGEAGAGVAPRNGGTKMAGPVPVVDVIAAFENLTGDNTWDQPVTLWSNLTEFNASNTSGYDGNKPTVTIGAFLNTNLLLAGALTDNGIGIANNYSFTKTGFGRVILTQAGQYSPATIDIIEGALNLRDSNAQGVDPKLHVIVWWGASLELQADGIPDSSGLAGTYNLYFPATGDALALFGTGWNGEGALYNMSGVNKIEGQISLDTTGGGPTSISVAPDPDPYNLQQATWNDLSQLTIDGVIQNIAGASTFLLKSGYGELVLTAANTYTGPTTGRFTSVPAVTPQTEIEQGWITVENDQALGNLTQTTQGYLPPVQVDAGASLVLKQDLNGDNLVLDYNMFLAGTGITSRFSWLNQNGALLNLDGDNTVAGYITLNGATGIGVELDGANAPTPPVSQLTLTALNTGAMISDGSSPGEIIKLGSQRLVIQEPGTYTGGLDLEDGVVAIADDYALGTGTVANPITTTVNSGTALELDPTIPALTGGISRGLDVWYDHLILNGTGNTTFGDAPVTVGADDNTWNGPITINANIAVAFDNQLANEALGTAATNNTNGLTVNNAGILGGGSFMVNLTTPGSSGVNAAYTLTQVGVINAGSTFTLTVTDPTGLSATTGNIAWSANLPVLITNITTALNLLAPAFGGTAAAGIAAVTSNSPVIHVSPNARFIVTGVIDDGGNTVASPLIYDYTFNNTFADSLGNGPNLVASGGVLGAGVYTFGGFPATNGANQGLTLTPNAMFTDNNYTIQMDFAFTQAPSTWNPTGYARIIDWLSRGTAATPNADNGLYALETSANGAQVDFYPTAASGPNNAIQTNNKIDLIVTRDGATGELNCYINGVLQFSTNDAAGDAILTGGNLNFFIDDFFFPNETSAGFINDLLVYNRPLTAGEVAIVAGGGALGSVGSGGSPASLTVAGGGAVLLTGANTYRGTTYVDNGILTIANNQALGGGGIPEVQTVTLTGIGTVFQLGFNGDLTPNITYTGGPTDLTTISNLLNALPTIGGVGGTATVSQAGDVFTIAFGGTLSGFHQDLITDNMPGNVAVALVTDGQGGTIVADGAQLQLQGNINVTDEPLRIQGNGNPIEPEVQTVAVADAPGGFDFTFTNPNTLTTSTSVGLPDGASAVQVQAALDQMLAIQQGVGAGGGYVDVTETGSGIYTVTFDGTLYGASNLPVLGVGPVAVQIVAVTGTAGSFTLNFAGFAATTVALPPTIRASGPANAGPAASLQNALNALLANPSQPGGGLGTAMVLATGAADTFFVSFGGSLAGVSVPMLVPGNFTGNVFATVTTVNGTTLFDARTLQGGSPIDVPAAWQQIGPAPETDAPVFAGVVNTLESVTGSVTSVVTDPVDPNVMYITAADGGAWKTVNALGGTPLWTPLFDGVSSEEVFSVQGTSGTFTLTFINPLTGVSATTPPLPYNATAAQLTAALDGLASIGGAGASVEVTAQAAKGVDEVQELNLTVGPPVAGTTQFILTFGANTTPTPITFTGVQATDEANITAALNALPSIGGVGGSVSVSESAPDVFDITFGGALAQMPQTSQVTATIVAGPAFGPVAASTVLGLGVPGVLPSVSYNVTFAGGSLANVPLQSQTTPAPSLTLGATTGNASALASPTLTSQGIGATTPIFAGAIAVDPADPARLYLGLGVGNNDQDSYYGEGVYESNNYGQTWTLLTNSTGTNPLAGLAVTQIAIDDADSMIFVSTTDRAVNSTAPGGGPFVPADQAVGVWRFDVANGWTNITATAFPATTADFTWSTVYFDHVNGILIAGAGVNTGNASNGVYVSDNPTAASPTWTFTPFGFGTIEIAGDGGSNLVGSATNTATNGLLAIETSANDGTTWTPLAPPAPNYLAANGDHANAIAVVNAGLYYLGGTDAGAATNFVLQMPGNVDISKDASSLGPHTGINAMALDADGNLIVATDGGVWRYNTATGNWNDLNGIGLSITQVSGVASNPTNPNNVLASGPGPGGDTGVGVSQYTGSTSWKAVDPTAASLAMTGGPIYYDPNNANVVYAIVGNALQYSINAGATWAAVPVVLPAPAANSDGDALAVSSLAVGADITAMVVGGNNYLHRIEFNYATGLVVSNVSLNPPVAGMITAVALATNQGPFTPDPDFPAVTDLGADNPDPNTVYVTNGTNLYVTMNNGLNWNVISRTPPLATNTIITGITVDPTDRDRVYVITGGAAGGQGFVGAAGNDRVFESANAGLTWTDISAGLPDMPAWTLVIDERNGNLYLGTDVGVYQLLGGAITNTNEWEAFGANLPNVAVHSLDLNQNTSILTAGSYGRGVWQFYLDDAGAAQGALVAAGGTDAWFGPIILTGPTTISVEGSQDQLDTTTPQLVVFGGISDSTPNTSANTLTKVGAGDFVLASASIYGGATELEQGNIVVQNPNGFGATTAGTTVFAGAILQLDTSLDAEPLFLFGNGVEIDGHFTGALEASAGAVASPLTYSGPLTLATNSTIGVDTGDALMIVSPGTITDAGQNLSLTKEGKGTLTLTSADTYGGGTLLNQGYLNVQNAFALGDAGTTTTVLDGAQLQLQGGINVTTQNLVLSGAGDGTGALLNVGVEDATLAVSGVITAGAFTLTVNGVTTGAINAILTGAALANAVEMQLDSAGVNAQATVNAGGGVTLSFTGPMPIVILTPTGVVGGTLALTLNSNNNSWGSATTGIVLAGNPSFAPSSTPAGMVSFGVANLADTLTIAGAIAEQPAQTQASATPPTTFATGLIKLGLGTLILGQANTYSGSTYVQGGVLDIQNSTALGVDAGQAVQRITTFDPGAADSFVLTYDTQTTPSLNFAASAGQIQTALDAIVPGGVQVGADTVYSGISAVQTLTLTNPTVTNTQFTVSIAGAPSAAIVYTGVGAADAQDIQTALDSLTVAGTFTVTADPTDTIFTITFGGTLQKSPQPLIGAAVLAGTGAAAVTESVVGVGGPEYVYTVTFLSAGPQNPIGITPSSGQLTANVSTVAAGGAAVQVSAGAALQLDGDPLHTGAAISTPATQNLILNGTGQTALAVSGTITGGYLTLAANGEVPTAAAITAATWLAGTAAITAANDFVAGQTVLIAGMTSSGPGSFNGLVTILTASSTGFTYALAANPGAASAFGTATAAIDATLTGAPLAADVQAQLNELSGISAQAVAKANGTITIAFAGTMPTLSLTATGVTGGTVSLLANGALRSASGNANVWNGSVTLEASTLEPAVAIDAAPITDLTVAGVVQDSSALAIPPGPANLIINDNPADVGIVVFAAADTYTGNNYVNNGALNIQNAKALGQNTNAEQTLNVSGFSGTFTLFFTGYPGTVTSGQLPFNITANALQTAIDKMLQNPSVPGGGVPPGNGGGTVSVTSSGTNFVITFGGSLAGVNVPLLSAPAVNFTASAGAIVGDLQAGGASTTTVAAGAALQMQSAAGFTESSGKELILNGNGLSNSGVLEYVGGRSNGGALENVAGTNVWGTTPILLGSNASIGADFIPGGGDELDVAQPIHDDQQVQTLQFNAFAAGDLYTLSFAGITTGNLTYTGIGATDAQTIQAALMNLATVKLVNGTITVAPTATPGTFTIAFGGPMAGTNAWPLIVPVKVTGPVGANFSAVTSTMVSSVFGVNKFGGGDVRYESPTSNAYTGMTNVVAGSLNLDSAATAIPANLTVSVNTPVDQVQHFKLTGFVTGDQFKLTYNGHQTAAITYYANTTYEAAQIQAALDLPAIVGAGNTATVAAFVAGNFLVNFGGGLAGTDPAHLLSGQIVSSAGGSIGFPFISTHGGPFGSAFAEVDASNQLAATSSVIVNNGGVFFQAGPTQTLSTLTIDGGAAENFGSLILTNLFITDGTLSTVNNDVVTVNGPVNATGGTIDIESVGSALALGAGSSVTATSDASGPVTILGDGNVLLGAVPVVFTVNPGAEPTDLLVSAVITGTGAASIVKAGAGRLELAAQEIITGGVPSVMPATIDAGDLQVDSIYQVTFTGFTAGDTFQLSYNNGLQSGSTATITYTGTTDGGNGGTGTDDNIATAIATLLAGFSLPSNSFAVDPISNNIFTINLIGVAAVDLGLLSGSVASSAGAINVAKVNDLGAISLNGGAVPPPAASLSGTGMVGTITQNATTGTVNPGANGLTTNTGVLTVSGNVTWNANSTFFVNLSHVSGSLAPLPGLDYDQLNVNGNVTLGNALLAGAPGPGTAIGDQYTILTCTGALSGQFNGIIAGVSSPITDGGTVYLNGQKFTVTYLTNSVVLTRTIADFTSFTVTASVNPSVYGQEVIFTALAVPEPGASLATANPVVTFTMDGSFTANVTMTINGAGDGVATFTPQSLFAPWAAGSTHIITATFADGNDVFASNVVALANPSAPFPALPTQLVETVGQNAVTVNVTSVPVVTALAPVYGQTVTVNAAVTPVTAPNVLNASNPTGNVLFTLDPTTAAPQTFAIPILPYVAPNPALLPAATPETATLTLPGSDLLSAGTHTVTAAYVGTPPGDSGDANYAASTAAGTFTFSLTYQKDSSVISFTPAPVASFLDQPAVFSVVVSPGLAGSIGVPQGTLNFYDGSTSNPPLNAAPIIYSGGTTVFSLNTLTQGAHTIFATFTDTDGNYTNSVQSTPFTVDLAATSTSFGVTTPAAPTYGQAVTLNATVSPSVSGFGLPTGTVTFWDGPVGTGVNLGTGAVNSATGLASITTLATGPGSLAHGVHTLNAVYSGDGTFGTSTGTTLLTVGSAVTNTGLVASPAGTDTWAQLTTGGITLSATVSSAVGLAPAGAGVTFKANGVPIPGGTNVPINAADVASFTTTAPLPAGPITLTATYTDGVDTNFASSVGTINGYVITAAPTTVVSIVPNPVSGGAIYGQPVQLTASVTSPGGIVTVGAGSSVTFVDTTTGATLGVGTLSAGGIATITTTALTAATHTITATYNDGADSFFTGASTPASLTNYVVLPATPTVALLTTSVGPTPGTAPIPASGTGQPVTFTATIAGSGGVNPTAGTVTFTDTFGGVPVVLKAVTLSGSNVANYTTLPSQMTSLGLHTITATYTDTADLNFTTPSAPSSITQWVLKDSTTTVTSSPSGTAAYSAPVTLTVTVTGVGGGVPSGPVNITDTTTDTTWTTPNLTASGATAGKVIFTIPAVLGLGSHSFTVAYQGDTVFAGSSPAAPLGLTVNPAGTTTTITAGPVSVVYGNVVNYTATVVAAAGAVSPTYGLLTFTDTSTNTILGTVALSGTNSGTLSTTQTLAAGAAHKIVATYTDNVDVPTAFYSNSSSVAKALTVTKASTEIASFSSSAPVSFYANQVTFTATVASSNSPLDPPTGTVTFKDATTGATLGSAAINAGGTATLTTTATQLVYKAAVQNITALFTTTNVDFASMTIASALPGGQTVEQAQTAITINPSLASSNYGQAVSFTAFLSAASGGNPGAFTGTVTFWQGNVGTGVKLGIATVSAGKATLTTTATALQAAPAGAPINAVYASTAVNIAGTTGTLPGFVVNQAVTTAKLTSSFPYWAVNTPVTFSAVVSAATGGTPVGKVSYTVTSADGLYTFTSGAATLSAGKATFAPFTFPATPEVYTVTLTYTSTNGNFMTSSTIATSTPPAVPGQQTQQDVLKSSSLSLAAAPNPTSINQTVTFTATLNGIGIESTLAAGGTVNFYDNGVLIGTGTAVASSPNSVTFTITEKMTTAGTHAITVLYSGDSIYNPAVLSSPLNLSVSAKATGRLV